MFAGQKISLSCAFNKTPRLGADSLIIHGHLSKANSSLFISFQFCALFQLCQYAATPHDVKQHQSCSLSTRWRKQSCSPSEAQEQPLLSTETKQIRKRSKKRRGFFCVNSLHEKKKKKKKSNWAWVSEYRPFSFAGLASIIPNVHTAKKHWPITVDVMSQQPHRHQWLTGSLSVCRFQVLFEKTGCKR